MRQAHSQSFREIREEERMDTAAPAIEQIKASMRANWMAGDFGVVARIIAGAAEEFIARLPIAPGAQPPKGFPCTSTRATPSSFHIRTAPSTLLVTMFGAMFAPRPEVVASELARVLKPGGLLAMAN
jgi:hypothetical protein